MNKENPSESEISQAISLLEPWCKKYPEITGPARHCAILYSRIKQNKKAISLLERCVDKGISSEGLRKCKEILDRLKESALVGEAIDKKDYKTARDNLLRELKKKPHSVDLINQLLAVYSQWIANKPKEAPPLIAAIESDIKAALRASRSKGAKEDESAEAIPSISESDLSRIIETKRNLVVSAALAAVGELNTPEKFKDLIPGLKQILKADKDNIPAIYYYAVCLFRAGADKFREGIGDRGKDELESAAQFFERVLRESNSEDMVAEAKKMLENIREATAALKDL